MKIILIIIGIIFKNHIDNSTIFNYAKNELLKQKGIKLYSIFKMTEYILLLSNKFGHDIDMQLFKIIKAQKIKHKIFSFCLLTGFIYANIYIIYIFYYCTWLIINDSNKSFIPIYLKVNYIEFKQSNKSFKSIHHLISNDIHDRFLNYFVLFFVFINGVFEGNINLEKNNIYLKKILFCYIAEFFSDYLKGIILFKIANINPKNIKLFLNEEINYYNQLKNEEKNKEYNILKNTELYEKYLDIIDKENILPIILNINIYPFYIIFLHYFLIKINLNIIKRIVIILIFISIKYYNEKISDYIIFNNLYKNNSKDNRDKHNKSNNKIKNE